MRAPFRVIIVTGASSGLGAELAQAYAAPAVTLGLVGRDRQRLAATADRCEARGANVKIAAIDVGDAAAMETWLGDFDREHPVDLVIANAGTSAGPAPDSPSEGVPSAVNQIRVNLIGAINTIEPLLGRCAGAVAGGSPWWRRSPPIAGCRTAPVIARARPGCGLTPRRCGRDWRRAASA